MAKSKDTDTEMVEHGPVLINPEDSDRWHLKPDVIVVRCVRHYKGTRTDEILGTFTWDEWEESERLWTAEVARIVKEIIPDAHWHDYTGLSVLYSKAMKIMTEDISIPFTYVMTYKGSWLTEVHHVTV